MVLPSCEATPPGRAHLLQEPAARPRPATALQHLLGGPRSTTPRAAVITPSSSRPRGPSRSRRGAPRRRATIAVATPQGIETECLPTCSIRSSPSWAVHARLGPFVRPSRLAWGGPWSRSSRVDHGGQLRTQSELGKAAPHHHLPPALKNPYTCRGRCSLPAMRGAQEDAGELRAPRIDARRAARSTRAPAGPGQGRHAPSPLTTRTRPQGSRPLDPAGARAAHQAHHEEDHATNRPRRRADRDLSGLTTIGGRRVCTTAASTRRDKKDERTSPLEPLREKAGRCRRDCQFCGLQFHMFGWSPVS